MSGFSQSLDLGDQTFASLEKQAGSRDSTPVGSRQPVLRRSTRRASLQVETPVKQPSPKADDSMEVIEESPTNSSRVGNVTRQKSVRERLRTLATQSRSRKGLRRSKSDSVGVKVDGVGSKGRGLKARSESRDEINLMMEHGCSELFRSDIRFDEGEGMVEKVLAEEPKEVNISKLLESDFNFEVPKLSGRPFLTTASPQAKISRKSDEFEDLFEGSGFSMDPQPRSQSTMKLPPSDGSNFGDFFESFFTAEGVPNPTEPKPEPKKEIVQQPPKDKNELDNSGLDEPLVVQDDDVYDNIQVENVTFTQSPVLDAPLEQQQSRSRFLNEELERTRLEVLETLRSQPNANTSLNSTLNNTVIPSRSQLPATSLPAAPPMTLDESKNLRQVSSWGLPEAITKAYARKGITELFQWQADCLANARVILECANLVYSAPTSGGKTIVSEFLVAKTVVERKRKALVILPFVAVAREKMYYLQEILSPAGIRVEGFFGGHTPPGGFDSVDVAVCTIEKANSIVNRLLEQQKLSSVGLVVVDEVHLISDPARGYILELLLTKIRFVGERLADETRIQIVAMSATLPNMGLLVDWLGAEQFRTDFRPIELREMVKMGNCIFDREKKLLRKLEVGEFGEVGRDQDQVAQLCLETILEGCSVIVFCPSKDWCEKLALHLAQFIYKSLKVEGELGEKMRLQMDPGKMEQALARLKNCPVGLDPVLGKTARYGCVYHHAGLTADERDIIESCFREGTLRVIVATSTLSSGVNLPARRVIIRTPMFGGAPMNALTYRQMIGRAGRKGRDVLGESILMCDGQNARAGWELVRAELKPIASCLDGDGHSHLKRAILEIIASGVASTTEDLERFVNCTLFSCEKQRPFRFDIESLNQGSSLRQQHRHSEEDPEAESDPISACVRFLLQYEFIRLQQHSTTGESLLVATQLGGACLAASMAPRDGFLLFSELQKARNCFVLETELHAIYLVTPYSVAYQWQNIDFLAYLERFEGLPEAMKRVGELVGIREAFLVKALRASAKAAEDHQAMQVHKRFYTALALQELVQEKPLSDVAAQFKCTRGMLQSLQQVAATFAGIVTAFCTSLNWNLLALIVAQFRERLFFGIQPDLLDLMRIPSLNGQRARMLFNGGVTGVVELASCDALRVERILLDCLSFQTEQKREGEDEYEARKRLSLRNLHVTGRAGLTVQEAARLLVKEARMYVQLETGVNNPDWQEESQEVAVVEQEEPRTLAEAEVTKEVQAAILQQEPASENMFSPPASEQQSDPPTAAAASFEVSSTDSKQDIECFHNSLIMNFSHVLNDSKVVTGSGGKYDQLSIVDLCASADLFHKFQQLLASSTSISISFGVSQFTRSRSVIGGNLLVNQKSKSEQDEIERNYRTVMEDGTYLSGVAFTLPQESDSDQPDNAVFYLNLRKDNEIKCNLKQDLIRELFSREDLTIDMFDAKDQLKLVHKGGLLDLKQEVVASVRDPKVACWLLQAEDKVIPLQAMVQQYCPEMTTISQLAGRSPGSTGPALNCGSAIDSKIRCTVESFLVHHLLLSQLDHFTTQDRPQDMTATFTSREMPIHVALARMELVGFPADGAKLGALIARLKAAKDRIAERVRQLNGGRKLDFGSTREVAAVLKVPKDRNGRARTSRQVLERIDSPLAALVIAWRKIDSNLSRTIEPLGRGIVGGRRIYGSSYCFTSTGRISMHEPNLQTVVKDFRVEIDAGKVETFSCRGTFACEDSSKVLISADFCQLELCVLTHLSQDRKLLAVMKSGKDVFRGIAAKWNHIEDEREVSDELRNYTKAIVYGVIYGMGARSMAAELNVDEDTARTLMEQFHATYPEIRRYAEKVVQVTRERGYIETLTGRRRYLPAIHSTDSTKRSEAERQAVCTTVQGSAADILKNAILRMARNLRKYRERLALGEVELVLHMHDELIFEAPRDQARKVGKILKSSMENCANLSLPLRVKVKSGPSWGELVEIQV